MDQIFALIMALIAYSCLAIGFVLQKKGIHWIGWKGKKEIAFYKNLAVWVTGFVIMNIYGVPSAVALKTLPPHIVASFAGWGIVLLVFSSAYFLKEKIYVSDYFYSAMIVCGIFLLSYFEPQGPNGSEINPLGLIVFSLIPPAIFAVLLFFKFSDKTRTVGYAVVCGTSAGIMVVTLRLLMLQCGYDVGRYFGSVYFYGYIVFAVLSLVSLQMALKKGDLILVGPLQYTSNILYPALGSLIVFSQWLTLLQLVAVSAICFAVIKILKKH